VTNATSYVTYGNDVKIAEFHLYTSQNLLLYKAPRTWNLKGEDVTGNEQKM
jgi:hypothetical protein